MSLFWRAVDLFARKNFEFLQETKNVFSKCVPTAAASAAFFHKPSDIEVLDFQGVFLDKVSSRIDISAHQNTKQSVGLAGIVDLYF